MKIFLPVACVVVMTTLLLPAFLVCLVGCGGAATDESTSPSDESEEVVASNDSFDATETPSDADDQNSHQQSVEDANPDTDGSSNGSQTTLPEISEVDGVVSMTVAEYTEWTFDVVNIRRQLGGKTLRLTGTPLYVGMMFGEPTIQFPDELSGVPLALKTTEPEPWKKVLGGQSITVEGQFELNLGPVKILDVQGSRTEVTAAEIATALDEDFDATMDKYEFKQLVVSGKVNRVVDGLLYLVTLEGANGLDVVFTLDTFVEKTIAVGDEVTLVGSLSSLGLRNDKVRFGRGMIMAPSDK